MTKRTKKPETPDVDEGRQQLQTELGRIQARLALLTNLHHLRPSDEQQEEIQRLIRHQEELQLLLVGCGVTPQLTDRDRELLKQYTYEQRQPLSTVPRVDEPIITPKEEQIIKLLERTAPSAAVLNQPPKLDVNRCKLDLIYLASRLFHIKYRVGLNEKQPQAREGFLEYTSFQRALLRLLLLGLIENRAVRIIVLKARQEGFTTTIWSFTTFCALTIRNFRGFFIIDKNEHSAEKKKMVIEWLRACAEALPWAPTIVGGVSTNTIMLSNGSILHFESAEADNPGSSLNVDLVHTSEETKWKPARATYIRESMFPGVPTQGFSVIVRESTAKGIEAFCQDYLLAMRGESEYTPLFVGWHSSAEYQLPLTEEEDTLFMYDTEDPALQDYDSATDSYLSEAQYAAKYQLSREQIKWRRHQIRTTYGGNRGSFDQEYPTSPDHAFRKQGWQFFPTLLLTKIEHNLRPPLVRGEVMNHEHIDPALPYFWRQAKPSFREDQQGSLYLFEWPQPGEVYYLGGDTAEGIQTTNPKGEVITDQTVFVVKRSDGRNVAYLLTRAKPEHCWVDLLLLAMYFNNARVNVELDKDGIALRSYFLKTNYPHNLVHPGNTPIAERTWTRTTQPQRRLILSLARTRIQKDPAIVPFRQHWNEMMTFIQNATTGKPMAAVGSHDDIVLADAQASFVLSHFNPQFAFAEEAPASAPPAPLQPEANPDEMTLEQTTFPLAYF